MMLHPDKCSLVGSEEAFKKIGAAYATLSDANKRAYYDTWGADPDNADDVQPFNLPELRNVCGCVVCWMTFVTIVCIRCF